MSIKTAKPSQILQPFLKQYWCIENVLHNGQKHIQRIIPSGLPELTLYIGNKPKIIGNKKDFEDNFILSGHQNQFYDLQIENELHVLSIVFQPQGLMVFFNLPLIELYNQSIPLKYLNRELEQKILPKLTNEQSFEKRIQIVENYFFDLLKEEHNRFEFSRIDHAINIIRHRGGQILIENLASEICLSRKQFERKFSELIGITPKKYLKTIRLQSSLYLRSKNNELNMTDLAYESGHYDQAHFINEFKRLTGFTPKQYFDNNEAYSDFFET
ncbi:helix-turn-helix transcriptional regulator [Marinifilum fragile]|uniref:helix-turn-helix transcriptional regulator n=1 Tax=Marinifilum fragile TaxID=570161 RepID=UPI002AA78579|nr:helix-turn-helix transcriptional regulator [Marinifilum fragile]